MSTITARAPHDQSVLGEVAADDPATVDAKVAHAREAMREWTRTGPMERATALLRIGAAVEEHLDDVARNLSLEQGKTLKEARLELLRFVGAFQQYAGLATDTGGQHLLLADGVRGFVEREPVGVVAGVVPWNFPASLYGSKLAPALAAGCAFLIKPAETTTLVTARLADLAGPHLPDGLIDVVVGGADVGRHLIMHTGVDRVAFTGSTPVGKRIAGDTAPGLKRLTLELGGCDPFILCEDANLPVAVRSLMGTRFFNAGQVCVAPKRLVAHESVADAVVELLAAKIERIVPGPGLDPDSTMGPLHTSATRERLEAQIDDAVDRGAKLLGGGRPDVEGAAEGWFVNPSLVIDPPPEARLRQEESFGPVLTVIRVRDDEEAVRVANETAYGLGCSVWSGNQEHAFSLARAVDAGYKWVNALGRVYDELPFGGVKDSGFGREHGREALESYLESHTYVYGE
ncbi:MAG: aldehyde dehydrogenase family protein [Actinobacteria bacterium]|nr:aldehyde dehydrogenase family protein [Actinomycetota bacterium]